MTFFNTNSDNKVKLRLDSIMANDVYQKNNITGNYDRIDNSSSEPISLPYYLKTTDIEMNNIVTNTGTVLNDNSLIIGDENGNEILDKNKVKILSQLKDNIVDVNISNYQEPFPVAYNKTTSNFERLSRLNIGTYSQYCSVAQTQLSSVDGVNLVQVTPTGLNIKSSTVGEHFLTANAFKGLKQIIDNVALPSLGSTYNGKFLVSYNKPTNTFERTNDISLGTSTIYTLLNNTYIRVANGLNYTMITSGGLTLKNNSDLVYLTFDDIDTLNKLRLATSITPSVSNKMLLYDPVSKIYNYATIPTSYTPIVKYKEITAGDFTRIDMTNLNCTTFDFVSQSSGTQPLFTYTNAMNTGDKLVLVSRNSDTSLSIRTNKWYVMKLTNNSPQAFDAIFTFDVFPELGQLDIKICSEEYKIHTRRIPETVTSDGYEFPYKGTIPANSIAFMITNESRPKSSHPLSNTDLDSYRNYGLDVPFGGTIIINCITSDYKTGILG